MLKLTTITFMAMASAASAADFQVTGKVTDVYAVTGYENVETLRHECYDVTTNSSDEPNVGGMIVGGLIGGVIGNQFGKGDGKEAMTGIGAMTGAIIGSENSKPGKKTRIVCEDVVVVEQQETVKYYVVEYLWKGFKGVFETKKGNDYYVGQSIQLNLTLTRF